jgi:5-enolpyruvylshikimate-3-phosphate synthase
MIESGIKRVVVENIANQRVKESNRIDLTIKNLKKIGVCVE